MVPLARALATAGHEVKVASSARFGPAIAGAGLEPVAAGPDWIEEEAEDFYPGFMSGVNAQVAAFGEIPKRGLGDDLVALGRSWKPDVIVHDHTELGGWIAGELLDVPHVPFAMTVRILDPDMLRGIYGDDGPGLLAHFGLPPDPELTRPTRWLYLDTIPPSFCALFLKPGPTVHSLRYASEDRTGSEKLPPWVIDREDRPLVYVTLGTIFNRLPGALAKLVHGAAALDVDVLVTTGRNFDPESLSPLPSNVRAERYVPQGALMPHCSAVVCHGGFNSVFASLAAGRPVVIVPFSADQPLNGLLCHSNGLGVSCTTETPEGSMFPLARPEALKTDQITDALSKVLRDSSFATAAGRMQQEIADQPGAEEGVALLEKLVATGQPVCRTSEAVE